MSGDPGLVARLALPGMAFADIADRGQDLPLPASEAVHVAGAGEKRRRDFALGRACARLALERLGAAADAIAKGPRGAPLWPDGIVGSITHTRGYAAAVAARATVFTSLGIDAEHVDDVSLHLYGKLFRSEEREALTRLGDSERRRAAAIIFSAKEAYYKACQAHAGVPQFQALLVTLAPDGFSVRADEGGEAAGYFLVADGLVLTLVGIQA